MRKLFTLRTLSFVLFYLFGLTGEMLAADSGVQTILTPSTSVCKGNATVSVIIQNYGGTTITSAVVHWSVNGSNQANFAYSGTIAAGNQDTVTLGNYNFTGGPFTVASWTTIPNAAADDDDSNDSASAVISVSNQLTGTYTIGGATPDYVDMPAAVAALVAYGICGPVTFSMRPQTDTMQVIIPQIAGADSINRITFQSQTGDSNSVILTFPSVDTIGSNYLILLDGADYINFHQLTLQRSGIKANGRVIDYYNTATNISITNCHINGVISTFSNSLVALLYSSGATVHNDSNCTISNNLLTNGALGIYFNGVSSLDLEEYCIIKDNQFVDQYMRGIQMSNQGHALIEGNTFTTTSTFGGYIGIYLDRSLRPHHIVKNKVLNTPGTGMYFVDCIAQSGVHGVIANNFIQSNDSAGISMVNGDYQDIVHNSILMDGTTPTFAALLLRGSGVGKKVINNILANAGGGYSYVVSDSAIFGIQTSDHNNLYTTGGFVGTWNGTNRSNLASWISASNMDSNSVSTNPNFVSATNLHATSIAMDDAGMHVNNVSDDIDGDLRSAVTPDIGADEYASLSRNVGIAAIISPVDGDCGNANTTISVVVTNTGQQNENNFNVVTKITGSLTQTLTRNHSAVLTPASSDTLTYPTTINTAAGGTYVFKVYTSLNQDDVHANDTLTLTITLSPPPASPVVTGSSICGPGSDTLTATSSDTIRWYSASSGGTLLATGPSYVTASVGTSTTYYVAAKSACEGPRSSVTLTVLPVPTVSLGNDTTVNQGASVTLNAGGGASGYFWSTGQTTQTISVNADGCYWVRKTNGSGCHAYDTLCVDVIAPFDLSILTITSPTNLDCADDSVQVMLSVGNVGTNDATAIPVTVTVTGAATATFHDTINSVIVAGTNVSLPMGYLNLSSGGVIIVTAYTGYSNDLDHTNDTVVSQDTLIVAPPAPTGISGARCGAGSITLNAASSDSIFWYDSPTGGTQVHAGDSYVIPGLNVTTTFYAQSGKVCNNQQRAPITATIHQLPPVDLGPDVIANDSTTLDADSGYVSYLWSNSSTMQTITVVMSDIYWVCVTDTNGCSKCDTINVTIINGIEQLHAGARVNLYPNPAHTSVTVEMLDQINGDVMMTMANMHGQIVWNNKERNLAQKTIDVSTFAKGIYYLQVQTEKGSSTYRLVVE